MVQMISLQEKHNMFIWNFGINQFYGTNQFYVISLYG